MEETIIDSSNFLPVTHFFTYKEKKFPFNMDIFNCFSQYFKTIETQYEPNSEIKLFDENMDIPESSVKDFINFCQKSVISINKENVIPLHKLAKKFKVPSLTKTINDHISTHQKDFVIEILLLNQEDNDNFHTEEYEEMISNSLPEYFQDDRLLTLPLPSLHRITTKYQQKNPRSSSEFIEFLIKCLDKLGREASVLFDHVDICGSGGTFLHRLLHDYSDKFDFHFINEEQVRTIYGIESEIISKIERLRETESKSKSDIELLNKKLDEMKTENDRILNALDESKRNREAQSNNIETKLTQILNEINEKFALIDEKITKQNETINQLNEKIEKMGKKPISIQFSASNPSGLVSYFRSSLILSSSWSNSSLNNILDYNNSYFCHSFSSESDCYIKFDFGSRKIDLQSYFIRSNGAGSSDPHPKSWRIEGSNDDSGWIRLDHRLNDSSCCGPYKSCHFICNEIHYRNESNRFRYIRYVQEDSWRTNNPHYIYITYLDLYGDAYK